MRTNSGMSSYPVFPDWVFTGSLYLEPTAQAALLNEIAGKSVKTTHWGGIVPQMTSGNKQLANLGRLVGMLFYDNMVAHYQLTEPYKRIEGCDPHVYIVKPGQDVSSQVIRHRWYQAAVFLNAPVGGSNIYLDMGGSKLYSTPPSVQEFKHVIEAEPFKVVFWPAHIPWGFTVNNSDVNSAIFTSTYIIKVS